MNDPNQVSVVWKDELLCIQKTLYSCPMIGID